MNPIQDTHAEIENGVLAAMHAANFIEEPENMMHVMFTIARALQEEGVPRTEIRDLFANCGQAWLETASDRARTGKH